MIMYLDFVVLAHECIKIVKALMYLNKCCTGGYLSGVNKCALGHFESVCGTEPSATVLYYI